MKFFVISLAMIFTLGLNGPALGSNDDGQSGDEAMVNIPHATQADEKTLIGGQPDDAQFREMEKEGYKTVVNLRGTDEADSSHQAELLAELGMLYIHIPVDGPNGLTRQAVSAFDRAVAAAGDEPALYHCASGNRVGAMFALRAGLLQGKSAEEAMALGRSHGMTGLAEKVEELLEAGDLPDAE